MEAPVVRLSGGDAEAVTKVLCDAFFDYPVMRFVLQDSADRYGPHLRKFVNFFVMARVLRGEPIVGVVEGDTLTAVALVSSPEDKEGPDPLGPLREKVWEELGPVARSRYESFSQACRPFFAGIQHIHLNMIGVLGSRQGMGFGRRLLEHIHSMSRQTLDSSGVSLTTESPANVRLYEHFGYEVVGHAPVGLKLETWGLFRREERVVTSRASVAPCR